MHRASRRTLIAALLSVTVVVVASVAAQAQVLPVTYKNSLYTLTYDAAQRLLIASSDNTECVWRTEISRGIESFNDIAAVATPAGPVIVYSEGNLQTKFALPHFRTGHLSVENSNEPLTGVVGPGRLLNCLFQVEDYGAKMICQLLESSGNMREYKYDINMWGTRQCIETSDPQPWSAGATPLSARVVNSALKFQLDVPQGFRHTQVDETSFAMYGPTNDVFMTVFSDAGGSPIEELGEAYMTELGVSIQHRSMETLDTGEPAYLLMGTGTINEVASLHVALVYSNGAHTWVLAYTGRQDLGQTYVDSFMGVLSSFNPL